MKKMIIGLVSVILVGCTNGPAATRALQGAGYTDIEITGFRFFGCHEDDFFRTGFKATGSTGKSVTGVVCGGLIKASTIRTD
jgi:hypothetical protein